MSDLLDIPAAAAACSAALEVQQAARAALKDADRALAAARRTYRSAVRREQARLFPDAIQQLRAFVVEHGRWVELEGLAFWDSDGRNETRIRTPDGASITLPLDQRTVFLISDRYGLGPRQMAALRRLKARVQQGGADA